ncbi:TetR/AcrR family transcriptional regulator C-terminal domain-containing protein, partial [Candidatus Protofrankia californiensis]|uniref:TetR/AcrR family transcriptional regulator C-terminal domain-containing protein n=1 Tax=Candidatus Protofrankia californiensis TaxID=1839754 RepID=UPI0019D207C0
RFPDLFRTMWASSGKEVIEALAGRMARLAHAGHLEITDPAVAAAQFVGLVLGDLPLMTVFAPDAVTPAYRDGIASAGVDTFLRAFGRRPPK